MKHNLLYLRSILWVLSIGCLTTSCVSYKQLTADAQYFKSLNDSLLRKISQEYEPVFQKGDILSIAVITPNENSARLFNQPNLIANTTGSEESGAEARKSAGGYLINEKGTIVFPLLGEIKAAGLTRSSLTSDLSSKLKEFIDSAIISIRLENYRVTVLGEVARPGTFSIPSERVTILDAIGLAGDLTVYGKRNNIRIIRTTDGVRQTTTLDLNKGDIFNSPFYYLRQNDIVYVEMNNRKIPNSDQASLRNISIALGFISALGVVASVINVLK